MPTVQHTSETRVQFENVELVYDAFGDPQCPAMLLIAGLGNQLIGWREDFGRQLAASGLFVIRFDNRDAGLATRFDQANTPNMLAIAMAFIFNTTLKVPYTLNDMAGDALRLLDHLGIDQAHILGASLGGMIAQAFALNDPERIRSLTLMLTAAPGNRRPLPRPRSLVLFSPPAVGLEAQVEHHLRVKRALRGPRFPLDEPELRAHARRLIERSPRPAGTGRQLAAIAAYGNQAHSLRKLSVPTLVIHGTQDPLLPPGHAHRLAELIPGAKLLMIEGLGHEFPPGIFPQVVDAILRDSVGADS
jgi:pimeloyl-ACP methyl ester carboxylesterase